MAVELDDVSRSPRAEHVVWREHLPKARNVLLEGGGRVVGRMCTPELVDESVGRDRFIGMEQEEREDAPLLRSTEAEHALAVPHLERAEDPEFETGRQAPNVPPAPVSRLTAPRQRFARAAPEAAQAVEREVQMEEKMEFTQSLNGRFTAVGPGLADVQLVGPDTSPLGGAIRLASQLSFANERAFRQEGTIEVGDDRAPVIATRGRGELGEAEGDGARHGRSELEARGVGRLAHARGRITSSFVVSPDGRVRDEQVVVLFIDREEK
jgi:hypothetical protein